MEYLKMLLCMIAMALMAGNMEKLEGINTELALVAGFVLCMVIAVAKSDRVQMLRFSFSPEGNQTREGNVVSTLNHSGHSRV
mgnify:CR=1 FL=1